MDGLADTRQLSTSDRNQHEWGTNSARPPQTDAVRRRGPGARENRQTRVGGALPVESPEVKLERNREV